MPSRTGHPDVQQDHVGPQVTVSRDGLFPVVRLADDLETAGVFQDGAQPGAYQRLIVGQQDAD
jgi:hypothetical protein